MLLNLLCGQRAYTTRFKYSITGKSLVHFVHSQQNHPHYSVLPLVTATVATLHVNQRKHVNMPTCSTINYVNKQFEGCGNHS